MLVKDEVRNFDAFFSPHDFQLLYEKLSHSPKSLVDATLNPNLGKQTSPEVYCASV